MNSIPAKQEPKALHTLFKGREGPTNDVLDLTIKGPQN